MKLSLLSLFFCFVSLKAQAQFTQIPDSNFEQALIDLGLDAGPIDGQVLSSNINTVESLNVSVKSISDLTGIQDFVGLRELICTSNNISVLDVSSNVNLNRISCSSNQISILDLSNNPLITNVSCQFNSLTTINISNNPLLTQLNCQVNQLSSLDLSNNPNLSVLTCNFNSITSLDVSNLTNLGGLSCNANLLTSLDISNNDRITHLQFGSNQIDQIDISHLTMLIELTCGHNNLTEIDLSFNSQLTVLNFNDNNLMDFPIGLENYTSLFTLNGSNNEIGGCFPIEFLGLCDNVQFLDFDGNVDDGVNNFISNEGWETFCVLNNGDCSCAHPDIQGLEALYDDLDGDNWTNTINNDRPWFEDCDPCGIDDGTPWFGIRCFSPNVVGEVSLGNNNAVGVIPPGIVDLIGLEVLNLVGSDLSGSTIPEELGQLIELRRLNLQSCQLTGTIPESLCDVPALESFNAGINQLSGEVPVCFADLLFLESFDVRDNMLIGSAPAFHGGQEELEQISIFNNNFTGSIPASYGELNLVSLRTQNNNLSGDYAPELGALCDLGFTNAQISNGNNLDEAWEDFCSVPCAYIPDDNFELALQALGYDSGPLDDCVPIDNINLLTSLDVSDEGIEDLTGLEFFEALETLDISGNELIDIDLVENGNLISVDASDNMIACFNINAAVLPDLNSLDVSNNNIAGCWPEEMKGLCTQLTSYSFEGNYFDGSTNHISDQGWVNFCIDETGICETSFDGWNALGSGLENEPLNTIVNSIAVDSKDNVYVGGHFSMAGGEAAQNIAIRDVVAEEWSALGGGLNGDVWSLAIDSEDNIYAGGWFSSAGDQPANQIARWDAVAEEWSSLGSGIDFFVYSLAIDSEDNVYAGGIFWTAGGEPALSIARWDAVAEEWSSLGSGIDFFVYSLAIDSEDNVYAGGVFWTAGGEPALNIARWDAIAEEWSSLGSGLNSDVRSLAIDSEDNVYAGGSFSTAGGQSANRIARWDAVAEEWSSLGSGLNNVAQSISIDGQDNIYVGGHFTIAGGLPASRIARYQLCQDEVVITCELPDGNYSAATLIQSTTNVVDGDIVEMSAPTILLNPGFTVFSGSEYEANNEGCQE